MLKVKVRWSGFTGSPGWSNFYFDTGNEDFAVEGDASLVCDRVWNFFSAIKTKFPSTVTWAVQSDVEVISETTGEMLNVWNGGNRATITAGGSAAPYSASSGMVITWRTEAVRNGRRVRGRTFLVPTVLGVYDNDGTINSIVQGEIVTAATSLAIPATGLKMGVYTRPSSPASSDGGFHTITSVSVPDMAAVLRSRRD